jgi:hypothetical protein
MKKLLSDDHQKMLRESKIISENEIVFQVGDLYVAENIISGEKRQIQIGGVIKENNNKRVLKG